jgi:hypothetical protein
MDSDPGAERPKPIQHRHMVELQQNYHGPNCEEWENINKLSGALAKAGSHSLSNAGLIRLLFPGQSIG